MFMKLLDDNQLKAEANANLLGVPMKNIVFHDGMCVISENPRVETEYKNLRWNVFHNFEPGEMLTNIQTYVFPFIKTIGEGKDPFEIPAEAPYRFWIGMALVIGCSRGCCIIQKLPFLDSQSLQNGRFGAHKP